MRVLHIINGYWSSSLYSKLIAELDKKKVFQNVYIPIRSKLDFGKNIVNGLDNTTFHYSYVIKSNFDRFIFHYKILKIQRDIERKLQIKKVDIIHAHTLFSDGAIAYNLYRKYNVPYIVTIRNTDINLYFKYFIHLRKLGLDILLNASKVVFISNSYKDYLINNYLKVEFKNIINEKSVVIPNGIDSYWIDNIYNCKTKNTNNFKLLYFGEINSNKNIHTLIKVVDELKDAGIDISLTIIGLSLFNKSKYEQRILRLAKSKKYINILTTIEEKNELLKQIREHDCFIMISHYETFGLVYAESLSQGLPIIYSKNQGFDNLFKDGEVGYAVDSKDIVDISSKIKLLMINYKQIKQNITLDSVNRFNWKNISDKYYLIYDENGNKGY